MFRDRPEMREPGVQLRMLLARREFDALVELARRRGRGHSPQTVAKEMIRVHLQTLAVDRLSR